MKTNHNRGKIRDNAVKALVRSNLFRHKVEKPKKGKGSYSRKNNRRDWAVFLYPSLPVGNLTHQPFCRMIHPCLGNQAVSPLTVFPSIGIAPRTLPDIGEHFSGRPTPSLPSRLTLRPPSNDSSAQMNGDTLNPATLLYWQ